MKNYSQDKLHFRMSVADIYSAVYMIVLGLVCTIFAVMTGYSHLSNKSDQGVSLSNAITLGVLSIIPFCYLLQRYQWVTPSFEKLKIGSYARVLSVAKFGHSKTLGGNGYFVVLVPLQIEQDKDVSMTILVGIEFVNQLGTNEANFGTSVRFVKDPEHLTQKDVRLNIKPIVITSQSYQKQVPVTPGAFAAR